MEDSTELDVAIKEELHDTLSEEEMEVGEPTVECTEPKKKYSLIQELLTVHFTERSPEEQAEIVKRGRPCPDLMTLKCLHKEKFGQYTRTFNNVQYEYCDWLCGCEVLNRLYCWPCLLFNKAPGIWNHGGFTNLNNIHSSQKKHKISMTHLQSVLTLTNHETDLGQKPDDEASNTVAISNFDHNVTVRKNLDVLKKIIDVLFAFVTRGVPLICDGDRFETMLDYFVKDEPALEARLKNCDTFRDLPSIRNDILSAMAEVTCDEVAKEIENTNYVTLMFDEVYDSKRDSQLSTIIRYVYKGKVFERFTGFADVNENRTAEDIFTHITNLAKRFKLNNKIVAQTYNGPSSSFFDFEDTVKKVQAAHPNAHLVNSYGHILNDVLSGSVFHLKECEIFFTTLNNIASFVVHSNGIAETLIEYLQMKLPSLAEGEWNFNSCLVYHVNVHKNEVIEFFQRVVETDERVDSKERMFAIGCLKFLNQFRTVFLLNLFSTIFNSSHKLFQLAQSESFDFVVCKQKAEKFLNDLNNLRENGFNILWDFVNERFQPKQKTKKICFGLYAGNAEEEKCKELFDEITTMVAKQTRMRFNELDKFLFYGLLNSDQLKPNSVKVRVSDELVKNLNETYPGLLDIFQIKNELSVLYNNTDFIELKATDPAEKMNWLSNNKLLSSFDGTYRLASLILTIPLTCEGIPFSESCLRRVENYFRRTSKLDHLGDRHAILFIEHEFLNELKTSRAFYDKVVEKFISINKDVNFQFKSGTNTITKQ